MRMKSRWRRRRTSRRRRTRSELQCSLLQQCSRVVLVAKAIVLFFPVNKEEDERGGEQAAGEYWNYDTIFRSNAVKLYS